MGGLSAVAAAGIELEGLVGVVDVEGWPAERRHRGRKPVFGFTACDGRAVSGFGV